MLQTTLVYAAVALATGFVLWTVVLPKRFRRAIGNVAKPEGRKTKGCGDDCGCG